MWLLVSLCFLADSRFPIFDIILNAEQQAVNHIAEQRAQVINNKYYVIYIFQGPICSKFITKRPCVYDELCWGARSSHGKLMLCWWHTNGQTIKNKNKIKENKRSYVPIKSSLSSNNFYYMLFVWLLVGCHRNNLNLFLFLPHLLPPFSPFLGTHSCDSLTLKAYGCP